MAEGDISRGDKFGRGGRGDRLGDLLGEEDKLAISGVAGVDVGPKGRYCVSSVVVSRRSESLSDPGWWA